MKNLVLFGLNGSKTYADEVAGFLDIKVSSNKEQHFDDGESYLRSDVNVRNADVYVIAGLYSDKQQTVNEKLVNLLWFCGSLKDASARRVTCIIPYFGYGRQDRKTESRAPITTKYMARTIQSMGVDRVLTIDIHSLSAFQNSFKIPVDNLDTVRLFTDYISKTTSSKDLVCLSPDIGGIARTSLLQKALEKRLEISIPLAVFDKRRVESASKNGTIRETEVVGSRIIGDVKGKRVIIYDDIIATGTTIGKAVEAVEAEGGEVEAVCCAHGLFTKDSKGPAEEKLASVKKLIITDTVPPWRLNMDNWNDRLKIIPTTKLFAQAIKRTHEEGGSISDLLLI